MAEGHGGAGRPAALPKYSSFAHLAGAAALAAAPSWWPWIGAALLLDHILLAVAGMWPQSRWLGPNLSRLPVSDGDLTVGLTFDDGPDPRVTPRVLDLLDEYRGRATFFCIGRQAERHVEIVREIAHRGHQLENHTYNHPNTFAFYGPRAMAREVDRTQEILERASGRRPFYFRAPAGIRNPWLDGVLARRGLTLASWTRRGYDTVTRDPRQVVRRLLKGGVNAGDVVLLHDGSGARHRDGQPVVLEALPRLLDAIAERGLRPVPLPDRLPTDPLPR